jgi:protein-disulfide isomerase
MAASTAMLVAALAMAWFAVRSASDSGHTGSGAAPHEPSIPTEPIPIGNNTMGDSRALLGLVVFTDYQCPYCARFERDVVPLLKEQFVDSGKLLFGIKHLPLAALHHLARRAAHSAECAGRQGQFWSMHAQLFNRDIPFDENGIEARARAVGLQHDAFDACMGESVPPSVEMDETLAKKLGISGTPTLLLGLVSDRRMLKVTKIQSGALSAEALASTIQDLSRAQSISRR